MKKIQTTPQTQTQVMQLYMKLYIKTCKIHPKSLMKRQAL